MELARTALTMVLSILLPLAVQLWDRRVLRERGQEQPWSFATWGAALYAIGPLSMLPWSWLTRGPVWRFFWGPLWLAALAAALNAADLLIQLQTAPPTAEEVRETALGVLLAVPLGVAALLLIAAIQWSYRRTLQRPMKAFLRRFPWLAALALAWLAPADARAFERFAHDRRRPLPPGREGWADAGVGAVRGVTVGPIESALHPGTGYGSARGRAAIAEAKRLGASWVALTPFGRVWDLSGGGVDLTFEAELGSNTENVLRAIDHAHEHGLRVLLVPHLWVEAGGWRALVEPGSPEGWARWTASYRRFLLYWADVAARGHAEMLSVGVELRSWVTSRQAPTMSALIAEVRARYPGLLTYSANWDDVEHTVILGELDVIGVNAFYPLTKKEDASFADLALGGLAVAADLEILAREWDKPVLLTEMGYTTRVDPALRPWEWPDGMRDVVVDERAQALAYRALLAPLADQRWCAGFFVWRTYADPDDVSQEAEWGFSPKGKLAELELRDAFAARWASDGELWAPWAGVGLGPLVAQRFSAQRARTPGRHAWEPSPPLEALLLPP
jgi:hypothetical protein